MKETNKISKIIAASSIGTMIEWYDFYIFGMLSITISAEFFPKGNPTAALLSTLAIFAAGFIVRPFGALVFGRLGDLIGRKYTFLLTLILMGGSTFLIGCVPGYASIGVAAPIIVLLLRLLQGLALGGEYGGAATYVAEHSPVNKRGYYTSWIQTTATLGLFLALGVILLVKNNMSDASFNAQWGGWRYPFWFSILLVGVSIYIRMKMQESPLFASLKTAGKISKNPIKESFAHKANFKMVLLALFGAVMGQGVVWYTGQFYAQTFLEKTCSIEFSQSRTIMLWAILFATPFFIFWGWLSDKVGRKWIMMAGLLGAVLLYRPIFNTFLKDSNVKEWLTTERGKNNLHLIKVIATDTTTKENITTIYQKRQFELYNNTFTEERHDTITTTFFQNENQLQQTSIKEDTKPVLSGIVLNSYTYWEFIILVFVMIFLVTMVYGPIAAFLVELFPTKIRYTSMSLPYHIGNGVFGGLVPFIGLLLTTTFPSDKLIGLWYPIGIAALSLLIGVLYLRNKIDKNVND